MPEPTVRHNEAVRRKAVQEVARFSAEVRLRHRTHTKIAPMPESDGEGRHFVGWENNPVEALGLDYQGRHRAAEVAAA